MKAKAIIAAAVFFFLFALSSYSQTVQKNNRPPSQTGYAPVNGLKMYYEIYGEGMPLVLIHGGVGAIEMFGSNIPELAGSRKVIAVDLQAHGRTADIDRPLSYELLADDIASLLKYLKIEKADVMGYSVGGGVMNFYTSIFKNSKISDIRHYDDPVTGSKRSLLTATFLLESQEFMVINGGPIFKFTEAVSFFVKCKTQEEVDEYWNKLCEGGQPSQCGWLKDKFGLSWQIIPDALGELLGDKNPVKAHNVMQAMLKMSKIDIKKLQEAYDQDKLKERLPLQ